MYDVMSERVSNHKMRAFLCSSWTASTPMSSRPARHVYYHHTEQASRQASISTGTCPKISCLAAVVTAFTARYLLHWSYVTI